MLIFNVLLWWAKNDFDEKFTINQKLGSGCESHESAINSTRAKSLITHGYTGGITKKNLKLKTTGNMEERNLSKTLNGYYRLRGWS